MCLKSFFLAIFFLSILSQLAAQSPETRRLPARKTSLAVKIDGVLDDLAWKDAEAMTNLKAFRPVVGAEESFANRTESYLMYNEDGIYFGGYCHEGTKDSIASELKGRDGFGTNDYIGIIFDTYHDKLNGFEYFVTPLNEQWDAKMRPAGSHEPSEDFSWNAVWKSATKIHPDGWTFEVFIPYSAIRFAKSDVQDWGMNITRRRRKTEQQYTWNPINPTVNGFLTQEGVWTGIRDIKQPVRLQFSPYFSVYANHLPTIDPALKATTSQINGGLDVKYGINQAFTLDMTLIPDFGQVQSDNQVLNLTPFEVRFNENRTFFQEGTELFGKGGLFYSRRIGGVPFNYRGVSGSLSAGERIVKNPSESRLINASKISGRNKNGLGIGILNAVTKTQYATIENIDSKDERKIENDPLTNYNILVLDQTFKNNSSVSFINTNVMRSGAAYDANVTAFLFDLNDKTNTWNFGGKGATSMLFGNDKSGNPISGYSSRLYFGKTSGRFSFTLSEEITDTKYSHNDLGYFTNNNYIDHHLYVGYRWIKPRAWYNRINLNFNANTSRLFSRIETIDARGQGSNVNINANTQTKKLNTFGVNYTYFTKSNDFYEPRKTGWYFSRGASMRAGMWMETNSAKKYQVYFELSARPFLDFYKSLTTDFYSNQRFRFNNKLSVNYSFNYGPRFNGIGYTWLGNDQIVFARRRVNTIENVLSANYNFTNRMGITFRARHYLSNVNNKEFFLLQANGNLRPYPGFNQKLDQNANIFNIDMVYTWQFAPGSFLNLVWKENANNYIREVEKNYLMNFRKTFEGSENNNFSLKIIYFLDYLQLKNWKK